MLLFRIAARNPWNDGRSGRWSVGGVVVSGIPPDVGMTTKIRTTGPMITGRVVILNAVKDPKDEDLSFRWSVGGVVVAGIPPDAGMTTPSLVVMSGRARHPPDDNLLYRLAVVPVLDTVRAIHGLPLLHRSPNFQLGGQPETVGGSLSSGSYSEARPSRRAYKAAWVRLARCSLAKMLETWV
jgi:hypothetical protein